MNNKFELANAIIAVYQLDGFVSEGVSFRRNKCYMAFYDKSDRTYFVNISFTDNGVEVEQSVRERGQIEGYRLSKFMSLDYAVPGTLINDAHAYRSWKDNHE